MLNNFLKVSRRNLHIASEAFSTLNTFKIIINSYFLLYNKGFIRIKIHLDQLEAFMPPYVNLPYWKKNCVSVIVPRQGESKLRKFKRGIRFPFSIAQCNDCLIWGIFSKGFRTVAILSTIKLRAIKSSAFVIWCHALISDYDLLGPLEWEMKGVDSKKATKRIIFLEA